ncbi:hypothetical protein [Pendulispora albinea]|uniref:Uncharacterized protein n=1 Tax=Pendulispora albinea TaxID=2741071 RepID=A0ABZ2M3Y9_9BACT
MDAPRRYLEELRGELGFYPMWMPADRIEVGSFGRLVRGVFRKEGSLSELGIDFVAKAHESKNSFKKHRGMTFEARANANAQASLVDGALGVTVTADSAYAWAFGAVGARRVELSDILQVKTAVLAIRRAGLWNDAWLLVSEVYCVDILNVVIAKSRDAGGEIRAKTTIPHAGDVLLAQDVSCHFDAADVFTVENAKDTTPLYGVHQVRGVFRRGIEPVRGGRSSPAEPSLERTMDASMFAEAAG